MADGDVYVSQVGGDWVVTIEGLGGFAAVYESRRDAVEAARRAAQTARSQLTLDLGGTAPSGVGTNDVKAA